MRASLLPGRPHSGLYERANLAPTNSAPFTRFNGRSPSRMRATSSAALVRTRLAVYRGPCADGRTISLLTTDDTSRSTASMSRLA
jgi:hypothetical protein